MRILMRADGDAGIGVGHVMRMLALAEPFVAAGGDACLASARLDPALERRATDRGVRVARVPAPPGSEADADWVIRRAAESPCDWLVFDGYGFGADHLERVAAAGIPVMLLDDFGHGRRYGCAIVLNQNVSARSALYADKRPDTRLLLGPRYALLRSEFQVAARNERPIAERASRVLVMMGGADPVNATDRVIRGLERVADPALCARVVIGPSNPRRADLAARLEDPRITLLPPSDHPAQLMAWADLAIAGAGTTTLELGHMGVPALLVQLADNQVDVARALARSGCAVDLGWHDALAADAIAECVTALCASPERRRAMAECGRRTVDGRGAARVLAELYPDRFPRPAPDDASA